MVSAHYIKIKTFIEKCCHNYTQNQASGVPWGSFCQGLGLETEEWKLESGKWTPEVRKWVIGMWKMVPRCEGHKSGPGTIVPSTRPASPRTPGGALFKYIRSGPEGARGVSDG